MGQNHSFSDDPLGDFIIQLLPEEKHSLKARDQYLALTPFPEDPRIQEIADSIEIHSVISCPSAKDEEWIIAIVHPLEEKPTEIPWIERSQAASTRIAQKNQVFIEGPAGIGKSTLLKPFIGGDLQELRNSKYAALTRLDLGTQRIRDGIRKNDSDPLIDRSSWLSYAIYGGYYEKVIFLYGGYLKPAFSSCENILILDDFSLSNEDLYERVKNRGAMDKDMPLYYHTISRHLFRTFSDYYGIPMKDIKSFDSVVDLLIYSRKFALQSGKELN